MRYRDGLTVGVGSGEKQGLAGYAGAMTVCQAKAFVRFASRIAELEKYFGMTSKEAIAHAVAGAQPASPRLAEWLVLLDRGDLV